MRLTFTIAIVYDKFHIIQWFNDQVIDSARRQEANRLKKHLKKLKEEGKNPEAQIVEKECRLLFGSRFLLLANARTLEAKDKLNRELNAEAKENAMKDGRNPNDVGKRRTDNTEARKCILKSNENLQNAVRAREELSDILSISNPERMREKLNEWVAVYSSVGVSQLTKFSKTITGRMEGIISRGKFGISSGKIEGVNSFIKAMRRSAFGYQDFDYFALLIWEQTHKNSIYGHSCSESGRRHYSRKNHKNQKRLKPTVFKIPTDDDKVAV